MDIQVQGERRELKSLKRTHSKGFFASFLSLFTGGNKEHKAEILGLEGSIARKRDIIKAPKLEQHRQINRTSNSNVGQRDTINHKFKQNQPHSTITDHKAVKQYTAQDVLQKDAERMERYKEEANTKRKFNDKSKQQERDHGREIGY